MKVLVFGASGMIGQGVLRECLLAGDVARVTVIGRTGTGVVHAKLREIVSPDIVLSTDKAADDAYDACFYCLGVSANGMTEVDHTRTTFDLALSIAAILSRTNPQMTFSYVSGAGTDSTERGRVMWARVKGRTENALRALPFRAVYLFRPGIIQPLHGATSKTRSYRIMYMVLTPMFPLINALFGRYILTTESIALAMLNAVRRGAPRAVLEVADIKSLSSSALPRG